MAAYLAAGALSQSRSWQEATEGLLATHPPPSLAFSTSLRHFNLLRTLATPLADGGSLAPPCLSRPQLSASRHPIPSPPISPRRRPCPIICPSKNNTSVVSSDASPRHPPGSRNSLAAALMRWHFSACKKSLGHGAQRSRPLTRESFSLIARELRHRSTAPCRPSCRTPGNALTTPVL